MWVGSFRFTGSLLLEAGIRMDYAYASCFSKISECSKSKRKNLACEVQETGFPSFHKVQSFIRIFYIYHYIPICFASSSCRQQGTKSPPTPVCLAAPCIGATCRETIQAADETVESRGVALMRSEFQCECRGFGEVKNIGNFEMLKR